MFTGDLRFTARSYGKVDKQNLSSGEAVAFEAVPSPQHLGGDAEIFGYRFNRIPFAHPVTCDGARVGAGIALLAGGYGDDQPAFGLERIVIQVISLGDGFRSRVIGSGD